MISRDEFERIPRHRRELITHAEKTTERHDCTTDFAVSHVEHDFLDFAQLFYLVV